MPKRLPPDLHMIRFPSIDLLVETYLTKNLINIQRVNVYEYLLCYETESILNALQSKDNKPSKHDLNIINVASSSPEWFDDYILNPGIHATNIKSILQIYKNRKVS